MFSYYHHFAINFEMQYDAYGKFLSFTNTSASISAKQIDHQLTAITLPSILLGNMIIRQTSLFPPIHLHQYWLKNCAPTIPGIT